MGRGGCIRIVRLCPPGYYCDVVIVDFGCNIKDVDCYFDSIIFSFRFQ